MSQASSTSQKRPRRRWYQYSLRTLLGLVTLAVAALVAWRFYYPLGPRKKEAPYAQGCGHLRGRFIVKGDVPAPPPVKITVDAQYASTCGVKDESIVLGPAQELANVVIWLRDKPSFVPDEYKDSEAAEVLLKTEQCRFEPHITLLRTTQTLKVENTDPIAYGVAQDSFSPTNSRVDVIPAMTFLQTRLSAEERFPFPVNCRIHPWMRGYVLVRDNPYMAVTGSDGTFEIHNLPAGQWEFQAWHEMSGYVDVGDWTRGRFKCDIEPGKTHDLGTIEVPGKLLTRP